MQRLAQNARWREKERSAIPARREKIHDPDLRGGSHRSGVQRRLKYLRQETTLAIAADDNLPAVRQVSWRQDTPVRCGVAKESGQSADALGELAPGENWVRKLIQ
jgi:hypothetical protein